MIVRRVDIWRWRSVGFTQFSLSVRLDVERPAGCDFFRPRWPTVVGRQGPRAVPIDFSVVLT